MRTVQAVHRTRVALALAAMAFGFLPCLRAADEVDYRARALALNQITGDKPIEGEIQILQEDPAGTKKLIAAAVELAKDKNPSFNYNAASILAQAAANQLDYDNSLIFYRICSQQARKVRSNVRQYRTFIGIFQIAEGLYSQKKFEASAKVAQESLETLERVDGASGARMNAVKEEVLRTLIRALTKEGKIDQAHAMIDNLVKSRASNWRVLDLKAWFLRETKHPAEAARTYEDVIPLIGKDESLNAREQLTNQAQLHQLVSRLFSDLKDKAKAEEHLRGAAKSYEQVLQKVEDDESLKKSKSERAELIAEVHYLLNQVYGELKEPAKADEHLQAAAKVYEKLLSEIAADTDLSNEDRTKQQTPIHYTLSSIYVDLNEIDKAAEHLKALLADKPDDPTYNNDLGYIWADHDQNLDEAEKLIRKALKEDKKKQLKETPGMTPADAKDNAAYLDSLGWVLFKKKRYEEAKPALQKAVQDKEGQHIEIFDHLGEVHMALGEKAEAIAAWKKGLEVAGTSKREQERKAQVEKKLMETEKTVKKD